MRHHRNQRRECLKKAGEITCGKSVKMSPGKYSLTWKLRGLSLDSHLEKVRRKLQIVSCVSVLLHSCGYLREIINSHSANLHPIKRLNFKAFPVSSLPIKEDSIFLDHVGYFYNC